MKLFNLKILLLLLLIFVISNVCVDCIIKYYEENIFIRECINDCLFDIYYYMIQEDSKNFYGQLIYFLAQKINYSRLQEGVLNSSKALEAIMGIIDKDTLSTQNKAFQSTIGVLGKQETIQEHVD